MVSSHSSLASGGGLSTQCSLWWCFELSQSYSLWYLRRKAQHWLQIKVIIQDRLKLLHRQRHHALHFYRYYYSKLCVKCTYSFLTLCQRGAIWGDLPVSAISLTGLFIIDHTEEGSPQAVLGAKTVIHRAKIHKNELIQ